MCQLFEVVHQAKQFPLPVHFGFAAQGEAVQAFVAPQVLHEGRQFEYAVFFSITKGGKSGANLNLFVNSAHERTEAIKYKKPIRFHFILLNRYMGKTIKPPA